MQPNYVQPTIQGTLLCEDVRREFNGMQTLVGVVNVIPAPQLPIGLLKLCLWTRWCNGIGRFQQRSRILTPDGQILGESKVDFELKDLAAHATNVHFFAGIQFQQYGVHQVEILLEENVKARYPLVVIQVQEQAG